MNSVGPALALALALVSAPAAPPAAPPSTAASTASSMSTAATASLPLRPAHAAVRAALLAGDATAVDAAFAADPTATGDGFVVRRLERADRAAACARIKAIVDGNGPLRPLALPRHLRCLQDGGDAARNGAVPGLVADALDGPLGRDASVIASATALVDNAASASKADVDRALAALLAVPLPTNEPARRAAVAAGLRVLVQRGSSKAGKAARARLLDELPEQPRGDVVDDDAPSAARRVARAAVLERLQKNELVVDVVGDLVDKDCDAALLVAKAKRKLRQYADSRKALAHATLDRCGETQKKARYLELRVASIQKGASVEPLAKSFLQKWGNDPLADDVLLWLAETREARGDTSGRDDALGRIVAGFPDGDMADDARFRLALSTALRGGADKALALLDDAAQRLAARKKPRQVDLDRARYWRARLALAPDPRSLDVVADAGRARAAWAGLAAFADERGASFYGQLARRLLRTGATSEVVIDGAGQPRGALGADAAIAVPRALAIDRRFALALQALDAGFDDEAATLLVDVVGDGAFSSDEDAVFAVAAAFVGAGRPDRAHQTLRNAGFALLPGEPSGAALAAWSLAWPRAFPDVLSRGAAQGRVPTTLLTGLAREESAFDANVVSWAGAVGLCQLMPTTALDEARALKLPPPSTSDLLDPALNARLGGAHLGRRVHGMHHPLLAIAAYNAGPGAVAKWMPPDGQSVPVDLFVEQIPVEETRNYVKKVTGSWVTYTVLDGVDSADGNAALDDGPLAFDVRVGG